VRAHACACVRSAAMALMGGGAGAHCSRTCEAALQALRDEASALYSLLEVFRYDPQYQWKREEAVRRWCGPWRVDGCGRGELTVRLRDRHTDGVQGQPGAARTAAAA
jgi:phosphatidylinositol kinase/protein kinase (PI-3  family)